MLADEGKEVHQQGRGKLFYRRDKKGAMDKKKGAMDK